MRHGDKVFSQSRGRDVIIVGFLPGNKIKVYDDFTGSYTDVSKSDLLEYATASQPRVCGTKQTKISEKKEGISMNIKSLIPAFGKVAPGECAITFDGQVVVRRNADEYVCYDAEKETIVNHLGLVVKEASKFIFILPVTEVAVNDVIRVKNTYYQVLEQKENGHIVAINLNTGSKSTICKETNAFGINFYSKVTSMFGAFTGTPAEGATAPAFNPMMLLALDEGDIDPTTLLALSGGFGGAGAQNPLLPLVLMGDKVGGGNSSFKELLMLQAFSGQTAGAGAFNPLMLLALGK